MARRLLLVDDDPRVGRGLQRALLPWVSESVTAEVALQLLATAPWDAIIAASDAHDDDGSDLLKIVADRFPRVARVAISDGTAADATRRTLLHGHCHFSKPFQTASVKAWLEQAFVLRDALAAPGLEAAIGRMRTLPSHPEAERRIQAICMNEDFSLDAVADVVMTEAALATKALQLVNSAAFGIQRPIVEVRRAVMHLGASTVRSLALLQGASADQSWSPAARTRGLAVLDHGVEVAAQAAKFARQWPAAVREEAFLGGLLHDVGRLVLLANEGGAPQLTGSGPGASRAEEAHIHGAAHDAVGGYLLALWALPDVAIRCALYHHNPSSSGVSSPALAAVHAADALSLERLGRASEPLDEAYVRSCGADPSTWRAEFDKSARGGTHDR